jgi:hypothetical protein
MSTKASSGNNRSCSVGLVSLIQSPMCRDALLSIEHDADLLFLAPNNVAMPTQLPGRDV